MATAIEPGLWQASLPLPPVRRVPAVYLAARRVAKLPDIAPLPAQCANGHDLAAVGREPAVGGRCRQCRREMRERRDSKPGRVRWHRRVFDLDVLTERPVRDRPGRALLVSMLEPAREADAKRARAEARDRWQRRAFAPSALRSSWVRP